MNHTGDLVGSDKVIMAYSDGQLTAGDISCALFYANSCLLVMHLYLDKSFATSLPGYAEAFHTLMKWEKMEMSFRSSGHPDIALISKLSFVI